MKMDEFANRVEPDVMMAQEELPIWIYSVCFLVFEFSISYSLNEFFVWKICRRKFCRLHFWAL